MAITFGDITRVSKGLKTVPIKSKDYVQVTERVKAFRMLIPDGAITTTIASLDENMIVMQATAMDAEGKVLSTGTAYEVKNASNINKTSYIENCETSAVGRCLAFLGIGIDLSIASAEELENALEQQESQEPTIETAVKAAGSPTNEDMLEVLYKHYPKGSDVLNKLLQGWNLTSVDELNTAQLLAIWNKYKDKKK